MTKLFAVISKELLILRRDRAGLLVLFVMPAVLVLVITLVQENMLKSMGETQIRVYLSDEDGQAVGQWIHEKLAASGHIIEMPTDKKMNLDKRAAVDLISRGSAQICIVVPNGLTTALRSNVQEQVKKTFGMDSGGQITEMDAPEIKIYYDTALTGGFRSAMKSALDLMVMGIEINEKLAALSQLLPEKIDLEIKTAMGPMAPEGSIINADDFKFFSMNTPVVGIQEMSASQDVKPPTSVQQNVPAWALFGIFFIVLPMSGSMIRERLDGTVYRLLSMPVSYMVLMTGKIIAFSIICVFQLLFILLLGKFVLPVLGTPEFGIGLEMLALFVVSFSVVLAATGYGIMLGTIVKTYEQASMIGPISVVIAAAIGGIMVPVFAMPHIMQKISILSPLGWAHNAYLDLLVRGYGFQEIIPEVVALLLFFAASLITARVVFSYRFSR